MKGAFRYIYAALALCGLPIELTISDAKAAAIDANLYTTYEMYNNQTKINWTTCGATQNSVGCFGAGFISPFAKACALMEGAPIYSGDVVARQVYVLDIGQTTSSKVNLRIYRKTDTITSTTDTTSMVLEKSVDLPLAAGKEVSCYMAMNSVAIFAGTNASTNAVEIWRSNWTAQSIGGFSPPAYVSSITASDQGYVSVSFKGAPAGGSYTFNPEGQEVSVGGTTSNILLPNTTNAVLVN